MDGAREALTKVCISGRSTSRRAGHTIDMQTTPRASTVPLHCLNCGCDFHEELRDASSCPHCASPAIWLTRLDIPLGRR
jgi:predicted Zn-ribbon and HTH transcriptional regulator